MEEIWRNVESKFHLQVETDGRDNTRQSSMETDKSSSFFDILKWPLRANFKKSVDYN